jgi:hypothetical protein
VDVRAPTLHLVRGDRVPAVRAEGDWVVRVAPLELLAPGAGDGAPVAAGAIDHAQLVELVFAAARVITW